MIIFNQKIRFSLMFLLFFEVLKINLQRVINVKALDEFVLIKIVLILFLAGENFFKKLIQVIHVLKGAI